MKPLGAAGGARSFFGAACEQQPVRDFSVGEDCPLGESSVGAADSLCEEGLGTDVRGGFDAVGDVRGSVSISWDELSGSELDLRRPDEGVCQNQKWV